MICGVARGDMNTVRQAGHSSNVKPNFSKDGRPLAPQAGQVTATKCARRPASHSMSRWISRALPSSSSAGRRSLGVKLMLLGPGGQPLDGTVGRPCAPNILFHPLAIFDAPDPLIAEGIGDRVELILGH